MKLPENFLRQLVVCIVLSAAFYGAWVVFGGAGEVLDAAARIGWTGWAIILGLSLLNYALRFMRWDFYLRRLDCRVPVGRNLSAYLAGFGFTTTPGKVGEAIRSVYLKPYGVTYSQSLAAFFVERLVDMLAMIVVASLAAYAFESMRWLVVLTLVLTLALLPLVHSRRLPGVLSRQSARFGSAKLSAAAGHFTAMLQSSASLLKSAPLYAGFGLGLIAWAAEGYALFVVLDLMGADVPVMLAAGIYGVSILAGVVSFVPGGLGGTEMVMGSLLALAGVPAPVAVSAVIICRVATLWFAVAIGLGFLTVLELQRAAGSRRCPGKGRVERHDSTWQTSGTGRRSGWHADSHRSAARVCVRSAASEPL